MKSSVYSASPEHSTRAGIGKILDIKVVYLDKFNVRLEVRVHLLECGNIRKLSISLDRIVAHRDNSVYKSAELYEMYFYAIFSHVRLISK